MVKERDLSEIWNEDVLVGVLTDWQIFALGPQEIKNFLVVDFKVGNRYGAFAATGALRGHSNDAARHPGDDPRLL